jgi:hypothetical protein
VSKQPQAAAEGAGEPIIDRDFIAAAVQAAADKKPTEEQELIAGEPLLSSYLRDGVLVVLGKLALAGAGPQLVEKVAEDMFRLIDVAVNSTRAAYRALLSDLLPENGTDGQRPPAGGAPHPDNPD